MTPADETSLPSAVTEIIRRADHAEASGVVGVSVLSALPSAWIDPVQWLFTLKPQIKARSAVVAQLIYWLGDGSDPVEHLQLDDFQWMIKKLMEPEMAKLHHWGERQILADMALLWETRRRQKRERRQNQMLRQERLQREEEQRRYTDQEREENRAKVSAILRSFTDNKRTDAPNHGERDDC